jgi:hypothetical protein
MEEAGNVNSILEYWRRGSEDDIKVGSQTVMMVGGWNCSGSCPVAVFGIRIVELAGCLYWRVSEKRPLCLKLYRIKKKSIEEGIFA